MKHDVERVCRETTQRVKEHFRMKNEMDREIERAEADGFERLLPRIKYDLVEPTEDAILMCAKLIHEATKAQNDARHENTLDWDSNKATIIAGIERMLENPNESPTENHTAWWNYKIAEGWKLGPVKDPVAKTHPCMVPYEELPPHQQAKDLVFQSIVKTFFGL